MPIQMIDIATMAPRSQEASMVQHNVAKHPETTVAHAGQQFNQQVQQDSQKTIKTTKDEWAEFQYGEGSSGGGQYTGQQKKRQKKNDEAPVAPRSNSSFDIMI